MDNNDITIDLSNILTDITISNSPQPGDIYIDTSSMNHVYTIDHSWIDVGSLTADTIDLSNLTINEPVEFEDNMPDVAKIEDMCNDYPALQQAYEKFKTIYAMVHQDWIGKQKQDV